jgi:hypothetical protein
MAERITPPQFVMIDPQSLIAQINANLLDTQLEPYEFETVSSALNAGCTNISNGIHRISAREREILVQFLQDPLRKKTTEKIMLMRGGQEYLRETENSDLTHIAVKEVCCGFITAVREEEYTETSSDISEELKMKLTEFTKIKSQRRYMFIPPCEITYKMRVLEHDYLKPESRITRHTRRVIEKEEYVLSTVASMWGWLFNRVEIIIGAEPKFATKETLERLLPKSYFLKPGTTLPHGLCYHAINGKKVEE